MPVRVDSSDLHVHVHSKNCESGFGAMGHPIPMYRMTAALSHLREMNPEVVTTGAAMEFLGKVASFLENDEPYKAQELWFRRSTGDDPTPSIVDLTGYYRLVAVMLCEPEPKK